MVTRDSETTAGCPPASADHNDRPRAVQSELAKNAATASYACPWQVSSTSTARSVNVVPLTTSVAPTAGPAGVVVGAAALVVADGCSAPASPPLPSAQTPMPATTSSSASAAATTTRVRRRSGAPASAAVLPPPGGGAPTSGRGRSSGGSSRGRDGATATVPNSPPIPPVSSAAGRGS